MKKKKKKGGRRDIIATNIPKEERRFSSTYARVSRPGTEAIPALNSVEESAELNSIGLDPIYNIVRRERKGNW